MKFYIGNKNSEDWIEYSIPDDILVVLLEPKDKRNIARMDDNHSFYCKFDEDMIDRKKVHRMLLALKKRLKI